MSFIRLHPTMTKRIFVHLAQIIVILAHTIPAKHSDLFPNSLSSGYTNTEPTMSTNFVDDERFDGLYLNVAETTRGIEPLLDTVFSFLRRKTDFFSGPPGSPDGTEAAMQKVNQVLQKHAKRYQQEQERKTTKKSKPATPKKKPSPKKPAPKKEAEEVVEMGNDGGFDISESASPAAEASKPQSPTDDLPKDKKDNSTDGEETKTPPPLGNGGVVEGKFAWTQTLSELSVTIPVPDNTRGRDLNVTIAPSHLKVGLRKQDDWIVNAALTKKVICDDSFWTVEDGNRLVITLQKVNQMEWWDSVCKGDPAIDVKTIQPENSSLGDLDGETRKTVEKMMFDQRQKALGRPTSDEQGKLDAIERFKKQHPELDFSNAKIT